MKKILKIVVYLLLGLLIALILFPYIFKKQIIEEIKIVANEQINAELNFDDVDISLIKSFPNLNVSIQNLSIVGHHLFEGLTLIKADESSFNMNISPLFKNTNKIKVRSLKLVNPTIDLQIIDDTTFNYDIFKETSDSTESNVHLVLEKYSIQNGKISFTDHSNNTKIIANKIDHQGFGDIYNSQYDLNTKTAIEEFTFVSDGFNYLNKIKTNVDAIVNIDLINNKYTLKENVLSLNKFDLSGRGILQILKDGSINIESSLESPNQNFSDFVSIMPHFSQFSDYDASGTANFKVDISGEYRSNPEGNPSLNIYPNVVADIGISKGRLKYPDFLYPLENINGLVKINVPQGNYQTFLLNVEDFTISLNEDEISGNINLDNRTTSGKISGKVQADIDLANWHQAIPTKTIQSLKGKLESNLDFNGEMDDIVNQNFQEIMANGDFNLTALYMQSDDKPTIEMSRLEGLFSKQNLKLQSTNLKLGSSDLDLNIDIKNPLTLLITNELTEGTIALRSNTLDLMEWMTEEENPNDGDIPNPTNEIEKPEELQNYSFNYTAQIDNLLYDVYAINDFASQGQVGLNHLTVRSLEAGLGDAKIKANGQFKNLYNYLYQNKTLEGKLDISTSDLNIDKIFPPEVNEISDEQIGGPNPAFEVPENLDLEIASLNKNITYNGINANKLSGKITIDNQDLVFENVIGEAMGGSLSLNGNLNTGGDKPILETKLDLSKIIFTEAFTQSSIFPKMAPIAKYMDGAFNMILVFNGAINQNMLPEFSTLTSSGYLETFNSSINNAPIFEKIGNKIGVNEIAKINLENTKNWFEILNGTVELKPQYYKYKGIEMSISGTHKIEGELNYLIDLKIPRSMIKKSQLGNQADKGLTWIENEVSKKGININSGEFIDFQIKATGFLQDPKLSIVPIGSSGKTLKKEVQDEANQKIDQAIDSLKTMANDKKETIKDTISDLAKKEIDEVKNKIEDKTNEAKKQIENKASDIIEEEISHRVDSILGENASDSLKSKAIEIIKNNTGNGVEDIKKKINDYNPFRKNKK